MGKSEGDAIAKGVGTAPDDAERAQPCLIEYLKRIKSGINGLRAFKMQNGGEDAFMQTMSQFIGGAHNLELPLRLSFKPEQTGRDGNRDTLSVGGIKRGEFPYPVAGASNFKAILHRLLLCRSGWKYREEAAAKATFARARQVEMSLLALDKETSSAPALREIQVEQGVIVSIENWGYAGVIHVYPLLYL